MLRLSYPRLYNISTIMTRYKNQFRIETARLSSWNYSLPGYYFVTICVKDRLPAFGRMNGIAVLLNPLGKIVFSSWQELSSHHNKIDPDLIVIMPDHVHGIVIIKESGVSNISFQNSENVHSNMAPDSLEVVIRSFKSAVTRWAHANDYSNFSWQSRYYDHIIRTEEEYLSVCNYILTNPNRYALNHDLYK